MKKNLKRTIFLAFGSLFFILGLIGVLLPILPTTPFMILSAACFAESSPRFHQLLLNNRWFGEDLQRWERNKTMKRTTKKRATWVIVISFTLSISILWGHTIVQLLLFLALVLLFLLWRVAETPHVIAD
ncbi:MAG: YbaN family protein [gamma proteobacterium symbiont of Lucinoma myriamae]|nr:YbaN family protein [gamma proteobacterium symbiont of Lucinoma myriamae]